MSRVEDIAWSLHDWFQGYPVFIQIALVMTVISVLLFMLGNASLAVDRMRASYRKSRQNTATAIITAELVGGMMSEEAQSDNEFDKFASRIKSLASRSSFFKQVVIDQIIYYHRNFTDSTEQALDKLFSKLELADSAVLKLKSKSWERKAKGMREIQEMKPENSVGKWINPLLNDPNDDLRIEAQATFLSLNKKDPFGFLSLATEALLPWHQIILFEIVVNTPDLPIPDLKALLQSKNDSVVSFCIKLAAYYHQLEVIPELISLLDHEEKNMRIETLEVLGKLNAEEAEPVMIRKFPLEDLKVQIKALESVGEIKSGRQLEFLKEQFLDSSDFALIKTAACAIVTYPGFDKDGFLRKTAGISARRATIMNHCANNLIRK